MPRVGSSRRSTSTENRAVAPTDFDQYCVTTPSDPRLPGGGNKRICGLYDVKPGKFGQVDNIVVHASRFGKQSEIYNGVNVSVSARHAGYSLAALDGPAGQDPDEVLAEYGVDVPAPVHFEVVENDAEKVRDVLVSLGGVSLLIGSLVYLVAAAVDGGATVSGRAPNEMATVLVSVVRTDGSSLPQPAMSASQVH